MYRVINDLNLKDFVKIISFIDGEEKLSAYSGADIFLTTANYRSGVLLTPIESIMCGTPVIITKEIGEIFENARVEDCLIEYGDVEGLREKIRDIINNPKIGEISVTKMNSYLKENLTWEMVANKIENLYQKSINNSI